ncbi:MAG: hypothetical protein RLZZ540_2086 [Bacteroidota bacterium]|jgi:hypothetical protein
MNKIDDLKKIKKLFDEGLISQREFESLKSEIIGDECLKSDTIEKTVTSPNKTLHNVNENKKECPNCKISLPIYTKKCGSCNYSFASGIIEDGNINNTIDEIENSDVRDKRNHLIIKSLAIIVLIIGCICFFLNKGNNINTVQNETENIAIDSSNYNINKDSLSINASNNSVPKDSTENNDSVSDENLESSEVNNMISLGSYYHGGIIFYLDYEGKHGLIRTNTIEKEDGFTWDMAKKSSEEYVNDGFSNWYLPESEELEMIFANKNDNLLKDGKYWCLLDGSKNGNFLGYTSSDNSFWTASRDYRVPMAIFISKF